MVLKNTIASLIFAGSLALAGSTVAQSQKPISFSPQSCKSTLETLVKSGITAGLQHDSLLTVGVIPQKAHIVSHITGGNDVVTTCADQKPKYATIDNAVEMYVVVEALQFGKKVYFTDAPCINVKGKRKRDIVKPWPSEEKPEVKWFKVEALENEYRYVSKRNPITYKETQWQNGWKTSADVHPTSFEDKFPIEPTGFGVMRYKVVVDINETELESPGSESIKHGAISTKVHQVSFRPNTGSWVDYLFELFNTPYIWGSNTSQIDGLIGSDCADFATYGWRRAGHKNPYTWSYGLRKKQHTERIVKISFDVDDQERLLDSQKKLIPYGTDEKTVTEGDIIFFPRHIAVLYKDNGNGYLDCSDLVLHTLFHEPTIVPLCEAFGMPDEVLRWKELLRSK